MFIFFIFLIHKKNLQGPTRLHANFKLLWSGEKTNIQIILFKFSQHQFVSKCWVVIYFVFMAEKFSLHHFENLRGKSKCITGKRKSIGFDVWPPSPPSSVDPPLPLHTPWKIYGRIDHPAAIVFSNRSFLASKTMISFFSQRNITTPPYPRQVITHECEITSQHEITKIYFEKSVYPFLYFAGLGSCYSSKMYLIVKFAFLQHLKTLVLVHFHFIETFLIIHHRQFKTDKYLCLFMLSYLLESNNQ